MLTSSVRNQKVLRVGHVAMTEGEPGNWMMLIHQGRLKILQDCEQTHTHTTNYKPYHKAHNANIADNT